jgi:outer membrane lipoprotein-sorting protein
MRTRVAVGLICVLSLLCSVPGTAQDKLPAAREIIDRYVQASGGREAMTRHSSRRAVGRISMPAQGVEGDVEILAARPDLMRLRMTIPGVGEIQSGYNGKVAWSVNPLTGPMLMQGKSLDQARADADFDSTLHLDTQYKALETLEKTTFEGRPAYKVRAVRTTGDEDLEYYDAENGLMLGAEVTRESPMGPVKATHVESDYKDFGGVKIATRITQRLMGTEQVITIANVEFDKVEKSAFDLPPAIQALVK